MYLVEEQFGRLPQDASVSTLLSDVTREEGEEIIRRGMPDFESATWRVTSFKGDREPYQPHQEIAQRLLDEIRSR